MQYKRQLYYRKKNFSINTFLVLRTNLLSLKNRQDSIHELRFALSNNHLGLQSQFLHHRFEADLKVLSRPTQSDYFGIQNIEFEQ